MKKQNRLLIIDALNMYFRAYIVDPSLSTNGEPIGGLKGTLKIFQKLIRETNPDEVVVCWDGEGGSQRRKATDKNYKAGRKPLRLNRDIRNLSEEEEIKNKVWQQYRLIEYLNETPFIQLMYPGVEADDVIAFVAGCPEYHGWQKIIVSSDKDFFQLLDNETVLFRPIQKEVLNKKSIVEKFGIHPTNFALARAIVGDKSDNLGGVKGVGLPTVAKRLPFLSEEKTYSLDKVIEYCNNIDSTLNAYASIVENKELIKKNYRLMQLYKPSISPQTTRKILHTIDKAPRFLNKTELRAMMIKDGFGSGNWEDLFRACNKISTDFRRKE